MRTLEGSMVALATPFRDGGLDEDAYRALIRYQLENGTQGLVPIGTTGEAATMSPEEHTATVKIAVEMAKGKVPVVAGAGTNSTQKTIAWVARVREAGADAALVVTPYYNRPPQSGLVEHFKQVAKAHPGYPLVVYNVPSRTAVDLLPETCKRLCDLPEVVAIKEASANMAKDLEIAELCGDRLSMLSGDDATVVPFIACGGRGVISVSANVAPRMMADLVRAARAGDRAQALELQTRMGNLHRLLFIEPSPIPVKWALHAMKKFGFGPEVRAPLVPMTEANAAKLTAELGRLGLM